MRLNKKSILLSSLFLFLFCVTEAQNQKFKVIIDAGHGGRDAGCVGRILKEKDLNLNIALRVGKLIEENHSDVDVIYTRRTDVFVPLNRRAEIANEKKGDLFISIHADAIPRNKNTSSVFGAGTFTLGTAKSEENLEIAKRENAVILLEDNYEKSYEGFDPNSAESYIMFETLQGIHQNQSIQIASSIQHHFKNTAKRHDRQVRQAPYLVLKETSMPSVLVEVGFLSNAVEEKFLATAEGKSKIATSIYKGFADYKEAYDRHNSAAVASKGEIKRKTTTETRKQNAVSNETASVKTGTTVKTNASVKTESASKSNVSKETASRGKVIYKVQFLSYHKKLSKGAPQLKGLWPVTIYHENGSYRYAYGESTNFKEITNTQREVRKKFKDAFVVRFKDGKRLK
ncbi:MAG: N-acetylmuramoyl-L-alanine amidase [Bacteroidales bacterium]